MPPRISLGETDPADSRSFGADRLAVEVHTNATTGEVTVRARGTGCWGEDWRAAASEVWAILCDGGVLTAPPDAHGVIECPRHRWRFVAAVLGESTEIDLTVVDGTTLRDIPAEDW